MCVWGGGERWRRGGTRTQSRSVITPAGTDWKLDVGNIRKKSYGGQLGVQAAAPRRQGHFRGRNTLNYIE